LTKLGVRRRSRRALGAAGIGLLTAALFLLAVPAAQAALGFQGLSAKPANLAAGANSNVNIHIGFSDPSDQVKDLTVHLPPGLVGNPTVTPLCTVAQLNADSCPDNSNVGTVTAKVNVIVASLPVTQTVEGDLYNLVPRSGEPARFGIVLRPAGDLLPKIIQQSAVLLRPSDFGLDTVINDFPRTASGLETDIKSLDIHLFGTANGKGFMRNPTSCVPKAVSFDATSYSNHTVSGSAPPFTPNRCDALPFSPKLSVELGARGSTDAGSITPLTTVVDQVDGEAGLENAKVLLPSEISSTSAVLNQCSLAQFQADASACPSASIVGQATATSTFLAGVESGPVVIVEPAEGAALPRLGVDLHGPLSLQLVGLFIAEAQGLGNAFVGLPDIPISHFELHFDGGAGGLISTSADLCSSKAPVFHGEFAGYNGARKSGDSTATVKGCGGGNKPRASVKLKKARSKHPRLRFKVKGGRTPLKQAKLQLPKGLRFKKGKAWRTGVRASDDSGRLSRSKLHHSRRKLKIAAGGSGAESLLVRVRHRALRRTKPLRHRKLAFPVTARDIDGRKTSLEVRVRIR
jgi:hypothetical protein